MIKGKAIVLGNNVDTDQIISGRYLSMATYKEMLPYCFMNSKNFCENYSEGDIIVAGENFGCGSSREQAPALLKEKGVGAIIAKSFARIFYRNAINLGIPLIECKDVDNIDNLDGLQIDLSNGVVSDNTKNQDFSIKMIPPFMLEILDAGGIVNKIKREKHSYIKKFDVEEISKEEQEQAAGYVCYERVIYYLFSQIYGLKDFSVLYLDRFWGWNYYDGNEPLTPRYNGLSEFLDRYVYNNEECLKEDLWDNLYKEFESGKKVILKLKLPHYSDGSIYTTSSVLEGMDEEGNVYYTKHTVVDRSCNNKVSKEKFFEMIDIVDGKVSYVSLNDCEKLSKLANMSFVDAYHYVFKDLYGYRMEGGKIYDSDNNELSFSTEGIEKLAEDVKNNPSRILTEDGIPKKQQFRLYVHINNKIRPLQYLLGLALEDEQVVKSIPDEFQQKLAQNKEKLDRKISDVQKFASLLFNRQDLNSINKYADALYSLKEELVEYQIDYLTLNNYILEMEVM